MKAKACSVWGCKRGKEGGGRRGGRDGGGTRENRMRSEEGE